MFKIRLEKMFNFDFVVFNSLQELDFINCLNLRCYIICFCFNTKFKQYLFNAFIVLCYFSILVGNHFFVY